MCGIAGIIGTKPPNAGLLYAAAGILAHRGPDQSSFCVKENMGFAHSRLSILDLKHGGQPAYSEDKNIIVVFNGEIFNFLELKKDLTLKGHRIENQSDTAVLPHLYEEYGVDMFRRLDGQFAMAIWDANCQRLILARDRIGKLPLFYTDKTGDFLFASEIKAMLKLGAITPKLSGKVIHEIFTYWAPIGEDSAFMGIKMLLPGHYMVYQDGSFYTKSYWKLEFKPSSNMNLSDAVEEFEALLIKAVKKRMMGDVPISTYLSGGLDSSLTSAIAAKYFNKGIDSFSIAFDDPHYDESKYQKIMAEYLQTTHHKVIFNEDDFIRLLKQCVYHAEVPFLRTGPLPMMKLSSWVRENKRCVVLTGEGSDEFFGGYDLFREVKIRDFCRKDPTSNYRGLLYKKINQFVPGMKNMSAQALSLYYNSVQDSGHFLSHMSRWRNAAFFRLFLSDEINACDKTKNHELLWDYLPDDFCDYTSLQKAQQLEIMTFMERYLLSTQGDRVSMANSVECRYPFLDNDLIEFALKLNDRFKIKGLNEKYIVKQAAKKYLPMEIIQRKKFPYRAPVTVQKILRDEYFQHILSNDMLKKYNIFKPDTIESFLKKAFDKNTLSERELMLFMGVITTQTLCESFSVMGDGPF